MYIVQCTLRRFTVFNITNAQVHKKAIKRGHSLSQVANVLEAEASASVRRYVQKQTTQMHTHNLLLNVLKFNKKIFGFLRKKHSNSGQSCAIRCHVTVPHCHATVPHCQVTVPCCQAAVPYCQATMWYNVILSCACATPSDDCAALSRDCA